jgi:hypothetical protein
MTPTLLISIFSFLVGIFSLYVTRKVWKKRVEAWKGMEDSPSLQRIQHYARVQYRIRVNLSISFILSAFFMIVFDFYIGQERLYESAVCLTVFLFLILLWIPLWGVVDALSSYIFLKKEDSLQIIEEEKERIRKKLKEEN